MRVRARDGNIYDVGSAAPGARHEVRLDGVLVGTFVLLPDETVTAPVAPLGTARLLVELADRFVAQGGGPMGAL